MTNIKSTSEAIEIITEKIRRMAEDKSESKKEVTADKCVECGGVLTHPGAFFCEDCAKEFYEEDYHMSEERLENKLDEICSNVNLLVGTNRENSGLRISQEHFDWLNKQVERVQELEEFKKSAERLYKNYHLSAKKSIAEKERLKEQNKRYQEEIAILGEVITSAENADELNREYERLMKLEGEE